MSEAVDVVGEMRGVIKHTDSLGLGIVAKMVERWADRMERLEAESVKDKDNLGLITENAETFRQAWLLSQAEVDRLTEELGDMKSIQQMEIK